MPIPNLNTNKQHLLKSEGNTKVRQENLTNSMNKSYNGNPKHGAKNKRKSYSHFSSIIGGIEKPCYLTVTIVKQPVFLTGLTLLQKTATPQPTIFPQSAFPRNNFFRSSLYHLKEKNTSASPPPSFSLLEVLSPHSHSCCSFPVATAHPASLQEAPPVEDSVQAHHAGKSILHSISNK